MSHIHFAAWRSVDIESLERMQRRIYIKRTRVELARYGLELEAGGQRTNPHYILRYGPSHLAAITTADDRIFAANGEHAFSRVMEKALELIPHSSSGDKVYPDTTAGLISGNPQR